MTISAALDADRTPPGAGTVRRQGAVRFRRERWGATLFDAHHDRIWAMDEAHVERANLTDLPALVRSLGGPGDPFLSGGPFFRGQFPEEAGFSLAAPISVSWVINQACQSSCIYCCTDSHPRAHAGAEPADALALIDLLAEWGVLRLIIGGGEPLLYPHLELVLERAAQCGLRPVLATNGFLLDAARAAALAPMVAHFQISLDSVRADTYAALRGRAGGPAAALAAIEAALATGVGLRVVTVLSSRNEPELREIGDAVHATGAGQWFLFKVQPSGRGARVHDRLKPSGAEQVRRVIAEARGRWPGLAICYWGDAESDGTAVYADADARISIHDYRANSMEPFASIGTGGLEAVRTAWDAISIAVQRRTLANFTAAERVL